VLRSGDLLSDRYQLDERVATGGMGDVWRATDVLLGRSVAVKVLLPSLLSDPSFLTRFRAEARMMAALHHPGIVQVYDCGDDRLADGSQADYLVMEFVAGEPLSRRIEAAGRLSVEETLAVLTQAAEALHAAHSSGIVHRDVKPSNLLVQPDGTVVLVDFGVARSTGVTSVTSTNGIPGTALYMAPEQAMGRPVSPATDIYALGAVAYCCLAGRPPFTGENALDVAVRQVHDEPPALPADIPAPVVTLVGQALAKNPADRYPSAAAFAAAARAVTGSDAAATALIAPAGVAAVPAAGGPRTMLGVPVVPAATPSRARGSRRRVVAGVGVAAVALLALGGLTAMLGFGPDRGRPATPPAPATSPTAPQVAETSTPNGQDTTTVAAPSSPAGAGTSTATANPRRSVTPPATARPSPSTHQPTSAPTPPPTTPAPTTGGPGGPPPSGGTPTPGAAGAVH
jgi:serine/threonine-protein kinase